MKTTTSIFDIMSQCYICSMPKYRTEIECCLEDAPSKLYKALQDGEIAEFLLKSCIRNGVIPTGN
jgi:hypothetical protein